MHLPPFTPQFGINSGRDAAAKKISPSPSSASAPSSSRTSSGAIQRFPGEKSPAERHPTGNPEARFRKRKGWGAGFLQTQRQP